MSVALLSVALRGVAMFALAAQPGSAFDPDAGVPPGGGYWALGEAPGVAPKDGEDERLAAYILLPLGTLTAATAGAMVWATMPGHCQSRMSGFGFNVSEAQCRGLNIYSWVRVSYGLAEVATGAVLLAIGLHRKRAYARWKQRRFQRVSLPRLLVLPNGAGASVRVRF